MCGNTHHGLRRVNRLVQVCRLQFLGKLWAAVGWQAQAGLDLVGLHPLDLPEATSPSGLVRCPPWHLSRYEFQPGTGPGRGRWLGGWVRRFRALALNLWFFSQGARSPVLLWQSTSVLLLPWGGAYFWLPEAAAGFWGFVHLFSAALRCRVLQAFYCSYHKQLCSFRG